MTLPYWEFHCHFKPVLLLWVSKIDDEEHYFLKWFGFIHIPNIHLGLGFEFEFWLQRIRDLVIGCPEFVELAKKCPEYLGHLSIIPLMRSGKLHGCDHCILQIKWRHFCWGFFFKANKLELFSNFSCMFLNPNIFFQFEFLLF